MKGSYWQIAALITILGATVFLYLPSLKYPLIWDDLKVVGDNYFLRSPAYALRFFQPEFWRKRLPISQNDYRPFQMLALSAIAWTGDKTLLLYHLLNVFLHLVVCLLLYGLLGRLWGRNVLILLVLFLFALHPVHVETILAARNISELLAAVFMLLALGSFLRAAFPLIPILLYALALLSKESSIIFPLLLVITVLILIPLPHRRRYLGRTLPFWILALLAGVGKTLSLAGTTAQGTSSYLSYLFGVARLLAVYFRLLLFPVPLKVLYPFPPSLVWVKAGWFLSLLGLGSVIVVTLRLRQRAGIVFWGLLAFLISLLPALSKVGQVGRIVAEQRLYFPSLFFCLLLALFFQMFLACPRRALVFSGGGGLFLLAVIYFGLSRDYLLDWRNDLSFWTRVAVLSPRAALAHNNLAIAYHRRGNTAAGVQELQLALRIDPGHSEAHNNLGVYYRKIGQWDKAIREFEASLKSDPGYHIASINLAEVLIRIGELTAAESRIQDVIRQNPYIPEAYNALAIVLEDQGEFAEAEASYRRSAELNPEYAVPLRNLSLYLQDQGKYEEALVTAREAIRREPQNPVGYQVLARVMVGKGNFKEARAVIREALKLQPDNWKLKSQLWALPPD